MANPLEQQLLGFTQPGWILNNLNTVNYYGAHNNIAGIQASIVLLFQKTHANNKPITYCHACTDFMNTNFPQHLVHNV